jgi:hypothetical protein
MPFTTPASPNRFSISIGWPTTCAMPFAMMRAWMSVAEPTTSVAMKRIGFVG